MLRPLLLTSLITLLTLSPSIYAEDEIRVSDQFEDVSTENYLADETAKQVELKPDDPSDPWKYFVPPKDSYDWVQLNSGEWLKGKIKVLYNEEMEFDSDELDTLTIDLEDIHHIRGGGIKNVRLNGPITFYGLLEVTKDQIIITQGESQRVFKRSDLVSITSGGVTEADKWSIKLNFGLDLSEGNTEQTNFSGSSDIRRRTADNRFVLTSLSQYSKSQDTVTAENIRINAFVDVFRSRQFYLRPISVEYFRDPFQNIGNQYTIGTGIGYKLIDTSRTEWSVDTGVAYQNTQFESVEPGEDKNISTPAFVAGTFYETEITKKIDFTGDYSFRLLNKESGTYTHHAVATISTELVSWLDFDISLVWDRTRDPTPNADGTVPEQDDYKLMFSLGIEY